MRYECLVVNHISMLSKRDLFIMRYVTNDSLITDYCEHTVF